MSQTPHEPVDGHRAGHAHPIAGFLTTVLVILAILLVAVAFAVRTRGGCELLADYLRDRTGLNLAVGGARFALPYDLVLENLKTRDEGTTNGSFAAREVRLEWVPGASVLVKARGVQLTLTMSDAGGWKPAPFAGLGELRDVRQTAALFGGLPDMALDLRDGAIAWMAGGTNTAAVEDLTFTSIPVQVPGRQWRLFELQAGRVLRAGGGTGRAVHRTWINAEENAYLELVYRGLWDEAPPAGQDWWSVPEPPKPATGVP